MLFFTYVNSAWSYTVFTCNSPPSNLFEGPRIRKKPVFCNMPVTTQEDNSRYNQLVDEVNNLCSENGAKNGWLVSLYNLPS